MSNTFNTNTNTIGVRVYITSKESVKWLPYLETNKELIEEELGEKLVWNPNPDNRDKVISLTKSFDLSDQSQWNEPLAWLTEKTLSFRQVFGRLIKEGKNIL